jgi:hypothetical protein
MNMPAGLPPPRPDQGYKPGGSPMAPGSPNIIRARLVIVSGTNSGLFVYNGTPGSGNLVASVAPPATTVDPFGNAVHGGGFAVYSGGGQAANLTSGILSFTLNAAQFAPATVEALASAGELGISSGQATSLDNPAQFALQSSVASGIGVRVTSLISDQTSLNVAATQNIPITNTDLTPEGVAPAAYSQSYTQFMANRVTALVNTVIAAGIGQV